MKLIRLSDTMYVNPDYIVSVEVKKEKDGNIIVVNLEDRAVPLKVPYKTFLADLISSGVSYDGQFFAV